MALFHRFEEPGFTNLFRMLDAFDNYNTQTRGHGHGRQNGRSLRSSFSPRFDVRETETAYELYGELPGIKKDEISIDFTEAQTLVISGNVQRTYSSGTPPAGLVTEGAKPAAITEGSEHSDGHKATVTDEAAEAALEKGEPAADDKEATQPAQPSERFWHQERSFGQFHRTFTFPIPIDEASAVAQLENGVLHLTIPKATKREGRRIAIN